MYFLTIMSEDIKIKKGDIIRSSKYNWERIVDKVMQTKDELYLYDTDKIDKDVDPIIFSISNTIKSIKNGIYELEKKKTVK